MRIALLTLLVFVSAIAQNLVTSDATAYQVPGSALTMSFGKRMVYVVTRPRANARSWCA